MTTKSNSQYPSRSDIKRAMDSDLYKALARLEEGVRLWMSKGVSEEDLKFAQAALAKAEGKAQ
jgi:hypothetical protein